MRIRGGLVDFADLDWAAGRSVDANQCTVRCEQLVAKFSDSDRLCWLQLAVLHFLIKYSFLVFVILWEKTESTKKQNRHGALLSG